MLTKARVKQSYKDSLQTILAKAIQKWDFAFQCSALQIIPDQANGPNICSGKGVRDDALYIEDITGSGSGPATSQGYWGLEGQTEPGRHTMKFDVAHPDVAKRNPHPYDVLIMAHELGELVCAGLCCLVGANQGFCRTCHWSRARACTA